MVSGAEARFRIEESMCFRDFSGSFFFKLLCGKIVKQKISMRIRGGKKNATV